MSIKPGDIRVGLGDGTYRAPFLVLDVRLDHTHDSTRILESGKVYSVWTRTVEVESEAISEAR